jgi:hypothetical protein
MATSSASQERFELFEVGEVLVEDAASGGWPVTAFHTVWRRHPATRYQSNRSSAAARMSTSVSMLMRASVARTLSVAH